MIHLLREAAMQLSIGPIRDLWPLLLLPALAAAVRDVSVRRPALSRRASVAQALLLAAPGALALVLIAYAAIDSFPPDKALRWSALWMLAPALGAALLLFALVRLWDRAAKMRALFQASSPPGPDLARLGEELGLRVRQVDTDQRACFVAGFARPTAFVGRDVPGLLTEAELRAVLMHERAHARAFDTLWLLALSILHDLRPVGGARALKTFLAGLERLADAAAARECPAIDLAAAILHLQGRRPANDLALPVADPLYVHWRLGHLLAEDAEPVSPLIGPALAVAGAALLLAWPVLQQVLHHIYCSE